MRRVAFVFVFLALAVSSFGQGRRSKIRTSSAKSRIPDQYVVVLRDDVVAGESDADVEQAVTQLASELAMRHGGSLRHLYRRALKGFAIRLTAAEAERLADDPRVLFVEEDFRVTIASTLQNATWGLDRIDQRNLPLDTLYNYFTTAVGVNVYVIDTGILATHSEFGGRVAAGFTAVNDNRGTTDCNGHGTHVAGTIGGATYGVAHQATLYAVRVLDCQGTGTNSGVIAGVDWVTANSVKPAVANMSLGGGASTALDDAVRRSVAAGVTYVVAAGNSSLDACTTSPARVPEALTVGASDRNDNRATFSNLGACLDLFAPGVSITSAYNTSDMATAVLSGTSMASPHVAGVAALYLSQNPDATPGQVTSALVGNATANLITNAGAASPNRLLHSLFDTTVDAPPTASFSFTCSGLACSFDASGSSDDQSIASYAWDFGDGSQGSGVSITHGYAVSGTYTVTLTVVDSGGQGASDSKQVTVGSATTAPCSDCAHFTGSLDGRGDSEYQPNSGYYESASAAEHRIWLAGAAGTDFNLVLYQWTGMKWRAVARSQSKTSVEQITYSGTAGTYRVTVSSSKGSGAYDLWIAVGGAAPAAQKVRPRMISPQ